MREAIRTTQVKRKGNASMKVRTMTMMAGLLGALGAGPVGAAAQANCEHRSEVELQGRAQASLEVDAGAGSLVVTGVDGLAEVRVAATLCASDRERLEALEVSLEGDRIDTRYPRPSRGRWWGGNHYARIDLVVRVPVGTNLRVDDSSGSIEVSGVGNVVVDDGSGSLKLRSVASVVVEDASGSLTIQDVAGSVDVEDGSGSVTIEDVTGSVKVDDGSGSLTVRRVGGDVVITDGSGSIEVRTVDGSVRVDGGGSGSVTVREVGGDLVVTDTRRSRIRYSEIGGTVDLPPDRRSGRD